MISNNGITRIYLVFIFKSFVWCQTLKKGTTLLPIAKNNVAPSDVLIEMIGTNINPELATATNTDILYHLFTSPSDVKGTYYTEDNIAEAVFNRDWSTKFFIHGWTTNEQSPWYKPMKDAYFGRNKDYNIFYLDWSKAGNLSYPVSAANTISAGRFIAQFIFKAKLNIDKVHVIGHSLGSHLASSIGKGILHKMGKKLYRITATDPAGPIFSSASSQYRLSEEDAKFVEVIHTDIGHYGFVDPLGHVDYYPNSGMNQLSCPSLEEDDNCSHAESNWLFIDSIKGKKYEARQAESWHDYLKGNYLSEKIFIFGEDISRKARGSLFFKT